MDRAPFTSTVTITPVDITSAAGLSFLSQYLQTGATQWVKVYGVPQSNGSINAYVLLVYTGTAPKPS